MTIFGKLVMGLVLVIIGGGVFYGVTSYVKHDTETPIVGETKTQTDTLTVATATDATTTEVKPGGKKIPFAEFMKKGGSYKCEVTQVMANMTSQGTVYIHDSLIRAEFSTTVAGQSMNTNMIARDGYTYSWTSMMPGKGYKTKIATSETSAPGANSSTSGTYTWNGEQVGDYSCEAWTADESVFELPKSVTFTTQ